MKDYKRILQGVVNIINITKKSDIGFANICAYIDEKCPELKESEGEKIRKEIIAILKYKYEHYPKDPKYSNAPQWIAWLEKQGEQKPAWSEEDEKKQNYLIALLQNSTMNNPAFRSVNEGLEEWLKSLKERVQPRQEWSEEDKKIIIELVGIFESAIDGGHVSFPYRLIKDYIRVLKSCLPQNRWKPSDEQMAAIKDAIDYLGRDTKIVRKHLMSLYEQLKKLREG